MNSYGQWYNRDLHLHLEYEFILFKFDTDRLFPYWEKTRQNTCRRKISVKTFGIPFQRNPSILDSAARQLRGGQRLTESFTTMSRKHSTLFSWNSEREVMPETRPRMNCVRRRRPRNFSGSHSTSDLILSRFPVVVVATFTYLRSAFFPQALEKWTSLSLVPRSRQRILLFLRDDSRIYPAFSFSRRLIFHRLSTLRSDPISRHEITKSHRMLSTVAE